MEVDNEELVEISDDPEAMPDIDDVFARQIDFDNIVNPANWQPPGEYYRTMPTKTQAVVKSVVGSDERLRRELRQEWLPQMLREGTLLNWESANPEYIELLQRKRLFTGKVIAADGTLAKYETLSLVGAQIAVSRVGYRGTTGQIVSNIMCWGKELPRNAKAAEIVEALRSRGKELKDKLPNLLLYALMTYKERQVLLDSPKDAFKLIQGPVFPHEMLSGSGRAHTLESCLRLIAGLIDNGNYATIVSKTSDRELELLGLALEPGEYLVIQRGDQLLETFFNQANYTDTPIQKYDGKSQKQLFREFQRSHGVKVVQGVLRAHRMSRPYVFYCNANRLEEAVHILLADAANTGARGFPLLIDLADQYCSGAFKAGEYTNRMNAEFARAAGGSALYQSERSTRD